MHRARQFPIVLDVFLKTNIIIPCKMMRVHVQSTTGNIRINTPVSVPEA